jgi:DNA replication and repair protein RecF
MGLNAIKILNFRNYERIELSPFGKFNVLVGINGSGKTNFLEAIFTLSQNKPFRKVSMEDLIEWGKPSFYIGGTFGTAKKEIGYSLQKKMLRQNNSLLSPVVVCLPDDITIVSGSPEERRAFMDRTIGLLDRDYAQALLLFQRVLRQRNAQLKISARDVHIWDEDFVKYGSLVIEKRLIFMQKIGRRVKDIYSEFYGDEVELKYFNTFKIEGGVRQSFVKALEENKTIESRRKVSMSGPHRDNFEIRKHDKKSRVFASQGQTRLLALALKLSLLEDLAREPAGPAPILLLDDVLLELDEKSRTKFLEKTASFQTFLTTTSLDLLKGFTGDPAGENIFFVDNGTIKI